MINVLITQDRNGGLLPHGILRNCDHNFMQVRYEYAYSEPLSYLYHLADVIVLAFSNFLHSYNILKQLRSINEVKQVILVTESTDYSEILAAVNLSVCAIIPSPVDAANFIEHFNRVADNAIAAKKTVKSAMETVDLKKQLRQHRRRAFFDEILMVNKTVIEPMEKLNKEFDLCFSKGMFTVIIIKADDSFGAGMTPQMEQILTDGQRLAERLFGEICLESIIFLKSSYLVMLLNYDDGAPLIGTLHTLMGSMKERADSRCLLTAGVGKTVTELRDSPLSFKDSAIAIQNRAICGTGQIYFSADIEVLNIPLRQFLSVERVSELTAYVVTADSGGLSEILDEIFNDVESCSKLCPVTLYGLCHKIEFIVRDGMDALGPLYKINESDNLMDRLEFAYNTALIREKLKQWVIELSTHNRSMENLRAITSSVSRAVHYINLHTTEPLTLNAVAEVVGLSPAYLSSTFKKQVGCSFCDYIHNRRIALASSLLTETNLSIADISGQVGFSDYRYFIRLFSKHTGSSPSKYRKASTFNNMMKNPLYSI